MSKKRGRYLILFNSYLLTVKSVYRKKVSDEKTCIYLQFIELNYSINFLVDNVNEYNFLKKGKTVTVHLGNGGYVVIEEGNKMPEEDTILSTEV